MTLTPQNPDEYNIGLRVHDNVSFTLDLYDKDVFTFDYYEFDSKLCDLDFYENLFINEWIVNYLINKDTINIEDYINNLLKIEDPVEKLKDFVGDILGIEDRSNIIDEVKLRKILEQSKKRGGNYNE